MKKKIGIFALVAGIGLLAYYFFKKQKDKKEAQSKAVNLSKSLPFSPLTEFILKMPNNRKK
ncbi:hypothetical protein [Pedobacter cryophilus]|uniref:Uncharacterized protein n=1 Tax=Pedobacter cryophilus TaxID=2571271 RepID=A0A4U1BW83_9SPHI|nr:hypothetical protein [Pedobacter cryophilus]TKB96848.1 hypothetical protein FA046_12280 [Pedobacter cryophilus]